MGEKDDPFDGLPLPTTPTRKFDYTIDSVDSLLGGGPQIPPLPRDPPAYRPRILFVDDEVELLRACVAIYDSTALKDHARLDTFHYTPRSEQRLTSAIQDAVDTKAPFDTIYIDRQMPGAGAEAGLGLIERLRERFAPQHYRPPFVLITAFPDKDVERRARELGAIRIIIKTSPDASHGVFGSLIHRLVTEARETLEQAEDEIWAEVNKLVADCLGAGEDITAAATKMVDFLGQHFALESVYTRRLNATSSHLDLIAAQDQLAVNIERLSLRDLPFLSTFVRAHGGPDHVILNSLSRNDVGPALAAKLIGLRVIAAKIRAGGETLGAITMYRGREAREFRERDARGLHHIASQLAAAMAQAREVEKVVTLQRDTVKTVQELDQAEEENEVYEILQNALFKIVTEHGSAVDRFKASIRMIRPGTNVLTRSIDIRGFRGDRKAGPISLEDLPTSNIARALWSGEAKYCADIWAKEEQGRHTVVSKDIRTSFAIPITSRGVCLGAACLESFDEDAIPPMVRDLAVLLSECAADSLIRLRTKRFAMDVAKLFASVTTDEGESEQDELFQEFVRLLFALTGAVELQYLGMQEGDVWVPSAGFTYPGERMPDSEVAAWSSHIKQHWRSTYIRKVLYGPRTSDWTHDPEQIFSDKGLRGGMETRSQAVVTIRPDHDSPVTGVLVLFFVQRFALNEALLALLFEMGRGMAQVVNERRKLDRFFSMYIVREQEARIGAIYQDLRHKIGAPVNLIREQLKAVESERLTRDEAFKRIRGQIDLVLAEIEQAPARVKVVEREWLDVGEIWSRVRQKLTFLAKDVGCEIVAFEGGGEKIATDRVLLETIFFHLIQNALTHGGKGSRIRLERVAAAPGQVAFDVIDTGRGFTAKAQKSFGLPGTSTSSTGAGLYLSVGYAADLGGRLELHSSKEGETRLRLSMPEGGRG